MSKRSFSDVDKEEATTAVAEAETTAVSTNVSDDNCGFAPEDVNFDFLQVLSRSSQFSVDGADVGSICVNKEYALAGEGEPLRCLVINALKYKKEDVPYGTKDVIPQKAFTPEEEAVLEANSEYKLIPVCELTVLVERPATFVDDEAAASIFIHEFGGHEYLLAKYTVQKAQAVRENYGSWNVVSSVCKAKGTDPFKHYFELKCKEKGGGSQFKWHAFVLSATKHEAPEEAVDFVKLLAGA